VAAGNKVRAGLALAVAVVAISWSAILVRLAAAPALAIAFYRMLFSTAALAPSGIRATGPVSRRDLGLATLAGVLLGLHFASWISSLDYTSVSSSVMLVTTQPLFTAILGPSVLGERVGARGVFAVILSLAGIALIAGGDLQTGGQALLGDGLAVVGALTASVYFMIGRALRNRIRFTRYLLLVNGAATLVLLVFVLSYGVPLRGFPPMAWLWFALLAAGPNLVGHGLLNWSVRQLPAFPVNMAVLGEPVLATLYAAILFKEMPTRLFYPGAALILAGLLMVQWNREEGEAV
jgi:drug/metabolite transporter (DMT)-like permease